IIACEWLTKYRIQLTSSAHHGIGCGLFPPPWHVTVFPRESLRVSATTFPEGVIHCCCCWLSSPVRVQSLLSTYFPLPASFLSLPRSLSLSLFPSPPIFLLLFFPSFLLPPFPILLVCSPSRKSFIIFHWALVSINSSHFLTLRSHSGASYRPPFRSSPARRRGLPQPR
ncbi:hypothetical protein BO86DRAFT_343464, partial [Aspergillus japonicus CBS 114.51]